MNIQKYTPPKIEFCTDYGEQPLLLAHVTKDRSMIAVLSLLGGFVAMAAVGFPGALLVGFAALNDISYAAKVDSLDDAPEAAKDDQGAIDVTATTVENDQGANQSSTPIAAAPSMIQSKVLCPVEVLGREPYQSTALIGGQRSGKTYIVALHTQNVKRKFKTKVIYINLYDATGDAADDWTHADVCLTYHIKKLSEGKAKAAIETVTQAVKEFSHQLNVILVFDEWVAFTSKSNAWPKKASQEANAALIDSKAQGGYIAPEGIGTSAIDLMNTVMGEAGELGSIGKKQIKALWLIAPSLKAGAIEEQGKVMKELAPMLVAIPPGRSIEWTHPTAGVTQEISFDDAGYRASMGNLGLPRLEDVPAMDCDRMMLLKGTWYSLDNLPPLEKTSTATIAPPSTSTAAPMGTGRRPTRIRLGASSATPDRAWSTTAPEKVLDSPLDPAIELINSEPNIDRRDALMIAYLWAKGKLDKGEEVSRSAFLERARKERKSDYLVNNRDEVWEDLQTLID